MDRAVPSCCVSKLMEEQRPGRARESGVSKTLRGSFYVGEEGSGGLRRRHTPEITGVL